MTTAERRIIEQDAQIAVRNGRRMPRTPLAPDQQITWEAAYRNAMEARSRAASGLRAPRN